MIMKIIFVLFFVLVSHFVGSSGKESEISDNNELTTHDGRKEVKSEHENLSQDLKSDANKNESCDCGTAGTCSFKDGLKICQCFQGYAESMGMCKKCDCGPQTETCKFDQYNSTKCTCKDGYYARRKYSWSNDTCFDCNCGNNSVGCYFNMLDRKICKCKYGTVMKESLIKCKECDCGKDGKCFFKNGIKTCECSDGYATAYGICKRCNCGGSFKNCSFETLFMIRNCICGDGYRVKQLPAFPHHEACYECDCGEKGTCVFDSYGMKVCKCPPHFKEVDGKCQEFCSCGTFGSCKIINGVKNCTCEPGFTEYEGYCKSCDCGNGKCNFTAEGDKCECDDGYGEYEGKCLSCDCGSNSTGCNIDFSGRRICSCKNGFAVRWDMRGNQVCEECDCGNGENCTILYGSKECICDKGLKQVNGKCQECDCGPQTLTCKLDEFKYTKCTCKDGYYAYRKYSRWNDTCLDCKCGTNSIGCYFNEQDNKVCKCKYGTVRKDSFKQCEECSCGVGGKSCAFTLTGKRQCTCFSAYRIVNDYINGDYCQLRDVSSYGGKSKGWQIATYVVSVLIVAIIIAMLKWIFDRRANRRQQQS